MKFPSFAIAVCLGAVMGFATCSVLGRLASRKNIFKRFYRLNPYIEEQSSYFPTASQLVAIARGQCPAKSGKVLVIVGGNSIFNGSGQKGEELWSRVLEKELGDHYRVVNFAASGASLMENGGVVFEILAREYPNALYVTNTAAGLYPPANEGTYSYLYWDAYYKGLLPREAMALASHEGRIESADERETKLGRRLDAFFYFNDLWNYVAYRDFSTIWTSWLQERSFQPRQRLPDWFNKRPPVEPGDARFQKYLPDLLEPWRHQPFIAAERFAQAADGSWALTPESIRHDEDQMARLLPVALRHRALIVLTPYNPWYLERVTEAERNRAEVSFQVSAELFAKNGFQVLPLNGHGFEAMDFGDTVHLAPAGGKRLAVFVAESLRRMAGDPAAKTNP